MSNLLFARYQMALTLGFHIIFAAIGIAMPFLMAASHWIYLKRKDEAHLALTKAWSRGVAIFFAVGAVSGTALSFELGLLWPNFMAIAGPIFGLPFALEGTAFFLEAIALGIFLYGWGRIPDRAHWLSGLAVGISGVASALFVICANAWMNTPTGFRWVEGQAVDIDPIAAAFTSHALIQGLHMVLAAFEAVGFAVAGLHAWLWFKHKHRAHEAAIRIAFLFAAVAALTQPILGDLSAKSVAKRQAVKLAAMEELEQTTSHAPLRLGPLKIPGLLSFLAQGDASATVLGLNEFPPEVRPPVFPVRLAFEIMVVVGVFLAGVGLVGLFLRRKFPTWFLKLLVACTPLGFVALEAGWVVTEVGRQPWIIYGILRTAEAVTPRPGIIYTFVLYAVLYLLLAGIVAILMHRQTVSLHDTLAKKKGKA